MLVQACLGLWAHYTKGADPSQGIRRRSAWRWFHIGTGVVTVGLLYAAVYDGFYEWDTNSDSGTFVPKGIRVVRRRPSLFLSRTRDRFLGFSLFISFSFCVYQVFWGELSL